VIVATLGTQRKKSTHFCDRIRYFRSSVLQMWIQIHPDLIALLDAYPDPGCQIEFSPFWNRKCEGFYLKFEIFISKKPRTFTLQSRPNKPSGVLKTTNFETIFFSSCAFNPESVNYFGSGATPRFLVTKN